MKDDKFEELLMEALSPKISDEEIMMKPKENIETMKRANVKKVVITAIAACLVFAMTALAAGKIKAFVSGWNLKTYENHADMGKAAEDAGEPSIPIIGDMDYNGLGVEKDYNEAINCYGSYNRYNLDLNVYYKDLNDSQKQILTEYIENRLKEEDVSYDEIISFSNVYNDKLNNYEESKRLDKNALEIIQNTPISERTEQMDNQYARYALSELEKTMQKPTENTGSIPKSLQPGDVFTFGCFNKEPIEWKVLERDSDGAFYVVSTKILFKSDYNSLPKWLNSTFLNYSFTEEEKKHIKPHVFENFLKFDDTYIYVPERDQLVKFEGEYKEGSIKQTAFAESQSKNNEVMCFDATSILPNGQEGRLISENTRLPVLSKNLSARTKALLPIISKSACRFWSTNCFGAVEFLCSLPFLPTAELW